MRNVPISFRINGEFREMLVAPNQTLLEVLRDVLLFTGTKEGCGNGNCGSCTVLVDGLPVNSCLVLGVEANGREVTTVEGLAKAGDLDPLQRAFVKVGGTQCGFCTPGMLMSSKALLDMNPHPTEQEIRRSIAGNLCRCTGYDKIVRAIDAAARQEA